MKRLLGFLVFVAIVIVAVGFWRHWFTINFNQPQIDHDTQKWERKIEHEAERLKEGVHTGAKKIEENTDNSIPPPPPPPPGS